MPSLLAGQSGERRLLRHRGVFKFIVSYHSRQSNAHAEDRDGVGFFWIALNFQKAVSFHNFKGIPSRMPVIETRISQGLVAASSYPEGRALLSWVE